MGTTADMYHELIYDLFKMKDPACDDFHRTLVSLPFRGILTTNYDTVLEAALGLIEPGFAHDNSLVIGRNPAGRVNEFLMSMNNDKRFPRRIAHLHGRFDVAESIVLDRDDYLDAYGFTIRDENRESRAQNVWTIHRKLLWAVLATRRVVFVGFGMNDPYFNEMLNIVSADLWRWNKSIHFAINSISRENVEDTKTKAEQLLSRYGVGTIFYETVDNAHMGLYRIVDELAKECGVDLQPSAASEETPGVLERSDGHASLQADSKSRGIRDWLNRANKRTLGSGGNAN